LSGAPGHPREARGADTRGNQKKKRKATLACISLSRLQLNDISLFFDVFEKAQDVVHIRTADMPLLMQRDRDALASLTGFTAKNK
jgi:hypothetical protein